MNTGTNTLFDVPGPRGRRRIRIAAALSLMTIGALALLAVRRFADHGMLAPDQWRMIIQWTTIRFLLTGAQATVVVTAVAAAIAFPLGAFVALARLSRSRYLRWPARAYVEIFRAIPILLLLYVFLFGLPRLGPTLPTFWQLVVPIVLINAAAIAEICRAGILALERGQSEAAYSLGMPYWQAMRLVVIPQAVRKVAPTLVSQMVRLLKDSTLGYVVSYVELLHQTQVLGEYYHIVLPAYLVVAVTYVAINMALSRLAQHLENSGGRRVRRTAKASDSAKTGLIGPFPGRT